MHVNIARGGGGGGDEMRHGGRDSRTQTRISLAVLPVRETTNYSRSS